MPIGTRNRHLPFQPVNWRVALPGLLPTAPCLPRPILRSTAGPDKLESFFIILQLQFAPYVANTLVITNHSLIFSLPHT